ncbi:hypothetical protein H632_c4612p0, partial [Helicosporidium sp. ATCC 50920]
AGRGVRHGRGEFAPAPPRGRDSRRRRRQPAGALAPSRRRGAGRALGNNGGPLRGAVWRQAGRPTPAHLCRGPACAVGPPLRRGRESSLARARAQAFGALGGLPPDAAIGRPGLRAGRRALVRGEARRGRREKGGLCSGSHGRAHAGGAREPRVQARAGRARVGGGRGARRGTVSADAQRAQPLAARLGERSTSPARGERLEARAAAGPLLEPLQRARGACQVDGRAADRRARARGRKRGGGEATRQPGSRCGGGANAAA